MIAIRNGRGSVWRKASATLAREHWATAKAMVERMGYHRRDGEVEEIAQQLGVELQGG